MLSVQSTPSGRESLTGRIQRQRKKTTYAELRQIGFERELVDSDIGPTTALAEATIRLVSATLARGTVFGQVREESTAGPP